VKSIIKNQQTILAILKDKVDIIKKATEPQDIERALESANYYRR